MTGFTFVKVAEAGHTVAAETQASFAAIDLALNAKGLWLRDLVKVRLLYTERRDFPEMNSVRDPLFRRIFTDDDFPAATGVCTGGDETVADLPRLALEVIAAPGKQVYYADEVVRHFGDVTPPYAHLNVVADTAFLSGQGAFDKDGAFRASGPVEETEKALVTFEHSLAQTGRGVEDIIGLTTYLKVSAMTEREIEAVLATLQHFVGGLGRSVPTVTCVGVDDLAFEGMTVEIEAVASAPGADRVASNTLPARWSGGPLAAGSTAIRSGPLVLGSASAGSAREAGHALSEAISEVGGIAPGALLTAWYAPKAARKAVHMQASEILPDAVCSLVPMTAGAGDNVAACVTLELFGNAA